MDGGYTDLRDRAYELADTGDFGTWLDLAAALAREGAADGEIKHLEHDHVARMMLARRMDRARETRARDVAAGRSPGDPFVHMDVSRTWWEWEASGAVHEPILVVETALLSRSQNGRHLHSSLLKDLASAAQAHFERLGFGVDRVRLVPPRSE